MVPNIWFEPLLKHGFWWDNWLLMVIWAVFKTPVGWLMIVGDYTTQYIEDYNNHAIGDSY